MESIRNPSNLKNLWGTNLDPLFVKNTNVTNLFAERFQKLVSGWVLLLQVPVEETAAVNTEALRTLQNQDYEGVYVTLSKEYPTLSKSFADQGIDLDKIHFIDCISQMYGIKEEQSDRVSYIAGPLSIDKIVDTITERGMRIQTPNKYVFLDSITTVLLYNSLERTVHFTQFLLNAFKSLGMVGVVVSVSEGFANKTLLKELTKSADEIINLGDSTDQSEMEQESA
ncbi:MAG: hypothetical protein S4CHLAM102_12260 [Chlamydiia bacterium]|nr:hypothetical protein [Chlamydiia bacterium]